MKTIQFLLVVMFALLGVSHGQTTISAGRAIEIRIQGVPTEETARINNTYPVSEAGYVRMPFIGNIRAAGLSPDSLAQSIEASYRAAKIYNNPTIQVFATSDETINELVLTVGGQVRRPGPAKYNRGMTLYDAVQAAGGPTEFGSIYRVQLLRNGRLSQFDLTDTRAKTFQVEPGDAIDIPQKNLWGR